MRIVSLLPSATEILCLLGLADQLVGVSADSDAPREVVRNLPVLNTITIDTNSMSSAEIDAAANADGGHTGASLYHVDAERLRAVAPDLILTQEICEVCAVSRRDVDLATRTLGYRPEIVSLNPATLEHVLDDVQTIADLAGVRERGATTVNALRARLEAVRARTQAIAERPRVFCMEWLDPPYTAGHWVPEMVEIAGGRDDLGTAGGPSRRIDFHSVIDHAPDAVVLIPCSLELERVAAEFSQLQRLPGWSELAAVRSRRVYAGNTHLFSCSGPRLVEGVEVLARMLHPDLFRDRLPDGRALKISADGQHLEPYS